MCRYYVSANFSRCYARSTFAVVGRGRLHDWVAAHHLAKTVGAIWYSVSFRADRRMARSIRHDRWAFSYRLTCRRGGSFCVGQSDVKIMSRSHTLLRYLYVYLRDISNSYHRNPQAGLENCSHIADHQHSNVSMSRAASYFQEGMAENFPFTSTAKFRLCN